MAPMTSAGGPPTGSMRQIAPAVAAVAAGSGATALSAELARYVAEVAGQAPSVHNTQPWRFTWDAAHFDIFADPTRRLNRLDPDGRLMTISCGTAIHHAQLAMRGLGWAISLDLLPNPEDPDHVARLTLEAADPTAPTAGEWALLQAVGERGTYRGHFVRRLGAPLLDELGDAVRGAGCQLYRIERSGQRNEVGRLIRNVNAALEADASYYEELARWRRKDEPAVDGIPRVALGLGRAAAAGTSFPPRDFGLDDRSENASVFAPVDSLAASTPIEPAVVEPDVLAIWTSRDRPQQWLDAGRALSALLLAATCAGAAAGLLDQPLEDEPARRGLRAALGVSGPVQVLLRIGIPTRSPEPTPRRPVKDTLA